MIVNFLNIGIKPHTKPFHEWDLAIGYVTGVRWSGGWVVLITSKICYEILQTIREPLLFSSNPKNFSLYTR
jgi:hypothetical protein